MGMTSDVTGFMSLVTGVTSDVMGFMSFVTGMTSDVTTMTSDVTTLMSLVTGMTSDVTTMTSDVTTFMRLMKGGMRDVMAFMSLMKAWMPTRDGFLGPEAGLLLVSYTEAAVSDQVLAACAEFPNDNPGLHLGAIWYGADVTGAATAEPSSLSSAANPPSWASAARISVAVMPRSAW